MLRRSLLLLQRRGGNNNSAVASSSSSFANNNNNNNNANQNQNDVSALLQPHQGTINPSPYVLFRYLESDWRQQIQRSDAIKQSKETFSLLQSAAASGGGQSAAAQILGPDFKSEIYMNRLLYVFTKSNEREQVAAVLRYIKDVRRENLNVFHFNFLLRCLTATREKEASLNLLSLMLEKEEVDAETVAIAIGAIHSWSGKNRFTHILQLIRKVHSSVDSSNNNNNNNNNSKESLLQQQQQQESSSSPQILLPFTQPWEIHTAWEFNLFPRPIGVPLPKSATELEEVKQDLIQQEQEEILLRQLNDEEVEEQNRDDDDNDDHQNQRREVAGDSENAEQNNNEDNNTNHNSSSASRRPARKNRYFRKNHQEALTLSALLHAIANGPEGPVAALVVACWMKAVGAELSAYDYFHILTAVARDVESFSDIKNVFFAGIEQHNLSCGSFGNMANGGGGGGGGAWIPSGCITLQRLKDVLREESERIAMLPASMQQASPSARVIGNAIKVMNLATECIHDQQTQGLLGSSSSSNTSSSEEIIDDLMKKPIYVGFVNKKVSSTKSVDDFIELIFDEIHRRPTVGVAGESCVNIHHAYALLLFALRRQTVAVLEVNKFLDRVEEWNEKFNPNFVPDPKMKNKKTTNAKAEESSQQSNAVSVLAEKMKNGTTSAGKNRRKSLYETAQADLAKRRQSVIEALEQNTNNNNGGNIVTSNKNQSELTILSKSQQHAPPIFPNDDKNLRLNMWFPKDIGFQFPFVPRAILDRVREGYDTLTLRTKDESAEVDAWTCWALGLPLLKKEKDIAHSVETVINTLQSREVEKSVRQMIRSLLQLFASLPPTIHCSKRHAEEFISKRKQWGKYFEARDTALALFGHTNTGREAMRRYFTDPSGRLQSMRSEDVIEQDVRDVRELFFPDSISSFLDSPTRNNNNDLLDQKTQDAKLLKKINSERISTTKRIFGNLPLIPHQYEFVNQFNEKNGVLNFYNNNNSNNSNSKNQLQTTNNQENIDAASQRDQDQKARIEKMIKMFESSNSVIVNPLGNPMTSTAASSSNNNQQKNSQDQAEILSSFVLDELFEKLNKVLKSEVDPWWFSENETAANYLRCLLHRYRWTEACDVAEKITHKRGFQAALDAEIIKIFEELGDPAGAMCFKFASKFIDGRILEDHRDVNQKRKKSALVEARDLAGGISNRNPPTPPVSSIQQEQ